MNYGEDITQLEHAIQCYQLAVSENASIPMRVAAFLHDVGHLFYDEQLAFGGKDMRHEELGVQLLKEWGFPSSVFDPIGGHVWAKRYLVSTVPEYLERLSDASKDSFYKQGGNLSTEEIEYYQNLPIFHDCILLRKWDDTGKIIGMPKEIPSSVWEDIFVVLKS